jgi:hypothetical protein
MNTIIFLLSLIKLTTMKKLLPFLSLLLFFLNSTMAQHRVVQEMRALSANMPGPVTEIRLSDVEPFLAWSAVWPGDAPGIQVRFSEDGRQWSDWSFVEPEAHAAELPGKTVGQLRFEPAATRYFQVSADEALGPIAFHFYSPGPDQTLTPTDEEPEQLLACPCPQPLFQRRSDWCPAGNCPPNTNPTTISVSHLIVHHSATANTASSWAAVVRSFWDFHVNTNGWSDIGYNWLIDPNGVVYEGRGDNILGAHFCGTNGATMGVCVIGDFTSVAPAEAAVNQLRNLLAWKACNIGANPLSAMLHTNSGLTLQRISGHRDGCSTSCPGNLLYNQLPSIRQQVAGYIDMVCSTNTDELNPVVRALQVFPNPAGEQLRVRQPEGQAGMLELMEAGSGRVLDRSWHAAGQQDLELSLQNRTAGLYLLRFTTADGQLHRAMFIRQ